MMAWWITRHDDGGYRLAEFVVEPENAIRGPYNSFSEAVHSMRRREDWEDKERNAAGILVLVLLVAGVCGLVWWAI